MNKVILYLGNDLSTKKNYFSAMEKLSSDLSSEGFPVLKYSDKSNFILRLLHMLYGIAINSRKSSIVFIDTFSTKAFYYALFTSQLCRFFRLPYVPILHGGNLPVRIKKSKKLSNLIFNHSLINVAPSNYLQEVFNSSGYKTRLIPNTIDIQSIAFTKRNKIKPKLLYVRAFSAEYNPTMAIEVLRIVKQSYANAQLCMIGPVKDDSFDEVKTLVSKYELNSDVEFAGTMSRQEWFEKSKDFDVFINTTNVDNTPVSVIEAMALGLPVVTTNAGGIPYLIDNRTDGLMVNTKDVQAMGTAIVDLISGNYPNLTTNARKKVEKFDWSVVKNDWIDVLNSVQNG